MRHKTMKGLHKKKQRSHRNLHSVSSHFDLGIATDYRLPIHRSKVAIKGLYMFMVQFLSVMHHFC